MGRDLETEPAASPPLFTGTGELSAEPDGKWRLELDVTGPAGSAHRSLVGDSCYDVAQAASLIIALAIDPNALPDETSSEPDSGAPIAVPEPPRESRAQAPEPVRDEPAAPVPAANEISRPRLLLGARGGTDLGALPAATPLLGAEFGLLLRERLRLSLGLSFLATQRARPNDQSAGLRVSLLKGEANACLHLVSTRAVRAGPCAGAELGRLQLSSVQVSQPAEVDRWWVALVGAARFEARAMERVFFPLEVGLGVPLIRERFYVENVGDLYRPPALSLRLSAGVQIEFW